MTANVTYETDQNKQRRVLVAITNFSSNSLKTLKLYGLYIDRTMVPHVRILFGKLESLTMERCQLNVSPIDGIFSECEKLQSFTFSFGPFIETSENDMPLLRSLKFPKSVHNIGEIDLHMDEKLLFLQQHKNLRELTIWDDRHISEYIAENMNKFEKICVESILKCTETCMAFARTEHIKKLTLRCCCCSWKEEQKDDNYPLFLRGLVSKESIQYLDLANVMINDGVIEAIGEFKNLRHLKLAFEGLYNYTGCLRLRPLEALSQLIELKMRGPWRISDTEVINLVKKLENLRSLSLCVDNVPLLNDAYKKVTKIVHQRRQSLVISFKQDMYGGEGGTFMRESFLVIERDASRLT